jgi:hypothetical protein
MILVRLLLLLLRLPPARAQLVAVGRSESEALKAERDELAEVVLEMQEEIQQLKAAAEAAAQ